jgi:NADH-quinone oxidoreductase subunit G
MCLVEVEKMPKLVIACSTYAAEGMVVNVNSEKSVDARKAVMEFILINHPLDCPICDEAGECKLQDYTFSHSVGESRFVEEKQHKINVFSLDLVLFLTVNAAYLAVDVSVFLQK